MFAKALTKRTFASLFNVSHASNPRAVMTVSQGGNKVGDMVFELYANKQPSTVANFQAFVAGGYAGTAINSGYQGLGFQAGAMGEENLDCGGQRAADEDLSVRHTMRGNLSMVNDGTNANGSAFTVTYGPASMFDGYNTCFGQMVSGEDVLAQLESATDRHGSVSGDFSISAAESQ